MNCPKCSTSLRKDVAMSRRESVGADVAMVGAGGLSCWCCGYWQDLPAETVLPLNEQIKFKARHPGGKQQKASYQAIFAKYYKSIKALRAGSKPAGWDFISSTINQAEGTSIKPVTAKKYFQEAARCRNRKGEAWTA
jgi:hypothetical protein